MKFFYTAKTRRGVTKTGEMEAEHRDAVAREMKARGLVVVSITKVVPPSTFYILPVSVLDRIVFTKHMAIMLRAGVVLDESLRIAELQAKGRMRLVLSEIRQAVEGGQTLSDAMALHEEVFSSYYTNMVRAGEESGKLAENLEQLSVRFAKDYELKQKAQSAMLYPVLVVGLTIGLGTLISVYILPRLSGLFSSFDFELPWTTRLLIVVSEYIATYGLWIGVGLVALFIALIILSRAPVARPVTHWLLIRLPVVRSIVVPLNLARLCMVLGSLLKSGLPIGPAIETTKHILGNVYYQKALADASARVLRGEPLSAGLSGSEPAIPLFVARMVQIGDETGKTEDVLFYLSDFYEAELDNTLKNLSTLIEPVMLVGIGAVVLGVALSIITPIYNFVGAIG